uniref:Uncharacterized protein n=1 Tax=Arundo donax TaxID=35708 RepID=A0A0A9A1A2_ARUDO
MTLILVDLLQMVSTFDAKPVGINLSSLPLNCIVVRIQLLYFAKLHMYYWLLPSYNKHTH